MTAAPAGLDHPCADHSTRRCLLCHPPVGVWVHQGGGDLRRVDSDGSVWTVCPIAPGDYALTLRYRDHRLTSHHADAEAAKQHRDDMARMFAARSLRDYAGRR